MSDRIFFSLALVIALGLIALASVYPQGVGRRSPAPFGHATAAEEAARLKRLKPPPPPPAASLRGPL